MCSLKYHHNPIHFIFLYWFFTTVQIKWISSSLFIILFGYGVNTKSMSGPWIEDWNSSDDILMIQLLCFCFTGATVAPYASYQYLWNPSFSCRGENSWNSLLGGECEWIAAGWVLLALGQRFPQLCLLDRTWFRAVLQVLKMEHCGSNCCWYSWLIKMDQELSFLAWKEGLQQGNPAFLKIMLSLQD